MLKLMTTDTDSFVYHIETEDFYKDMYKEAYRYYDETNKKVLGLFKDETP